MAKHTPRRNKNGAIDGRTLDHQSLERLRLRALDQIENGARIIDVARALGFDHAVVSRWVTRARREGREALLSQPISGRPPKLDDEPGRDRPLGAVADPSTAVGLCLGVVDAGDGARGDRADVRDPR